MAQTTFISGTASYRDVDLSFLPHPNTSDLRRKRDVEAVKQSVTNLISTQRGERPFKPALGTRLFKYLFEPLDDITKTEIRREVITTLETYESRVEVLKVDVTGERERNQLDITVHIKILALNVEETVRSTVKRLR